MGRIMFLFFLSSVTILSGLLPGAQHGKIQGRPAHTTTDTGDTDDVGKQNEKL
jgi:hypothetical protein